MNISVGASSCQVCFNALLLISLGVLFRRQTVAGGPCSDDVLYKCIIQAFVFKERGVLSTEHAGVLFSLANFLFPPNTNTISLVFCHECRATHFEDF